MRHFRYLPIALVLLASGCGGLDFLHDLKLDFYIAGFLHPGYAEDQLVQEPRFEGVWQERDDDDTRGIIEYEGNNVYSLRFVEQKGGEEKMVMSLAGRLFDLDGTLMLDTRYAINEDIVPEGAWLYFVPMRQFFMVNLEEDSLTLSLVNPIELGERLKKTPELLPHVVEQSHYLVTAETHEIRSFLKQAIQDEPLLSDLELIRVRSE